MFLMAFFLEPLRLPSVHNEYASLKERSGQSKPNRGGSLLIFVAL